MTKKNNFTNLFIATCSVLILASCSSNKLQRDISDAPSAHKKQEVTRELHKVGDTVYFKFNSAILSQESKDTLDKQIEVLRQMTNNQYSFIIEGYGDERGTREVNLALGAHRAENTKRYLISKGVPPSMLRVISYGKDKVLVYGHNEEAWRQNRVARIVINN